MDFCLLEALSVGDALELWLFWCNKIIVVFWAYISIPLNYAMLKAM